jgi:radical SAM protein with 4Fe4S-binding SPASM domain
MSYEMHEYKSANLKVNSKCNLNCEFCYETNFQKKDLSFHEIHVLLKDFKDLGFQSIKLSGGEPLLRDDLEQIIKQARSYNLIVQLATNGKTLTKERLDCLEHVGLNEIYISLGSSLEENTVKYLGELCKYKKLNNYKIKVGANLIIGKTFINIFDRNISMLYNNGIKLLYVIPPKKGGISGWFESEKLDFVDYIKIYKIINYTNKYFDFVLDCGFNCINSTIGQDEICHAGKLSLAVSSDGNVIPCPFFNQQEYVIGNIREQSLKTILACKTFDTFLSYQYESKETIGEPPCIRRDI